VDSGRRLAQHAEAGSREAGVAVRRDNPYGAFNFLVELGDGAAAGFSEVSGLSIEMGVIRYREGSDKRNAVRKLPGLHKVSDVTLKRGIVGGLELYQWLRQAMLGMVERRTVVIHLMPEDLSGPVLSWKLVNAWPVKLTHGPLVAAGDLVAVEELVLAADSLEIE
jgi:phage tail-like protein